MMCVREEMPTDIPAIRAVLKAAFGGVAERDLVERLRADGDLVLSLVVERADEVVGHCGFSRLKISSDDIETNAVSLAPIGVLPVLQKQGAGIAMIRHGISRLKQTGETLIVVLGAPSYYSRFGFEATAAADFHTPYAGPHLQVLRLTANAPARGDIRYPSAFAGL